MIYDLQKASLLKRISAWLLDFILVVILSVGAAAALSALLGYDAQNAKWDNYRDYYEEKYELPSEMTQEKIDAMTEEEFEQYKASVEAANKALNGDKEAMRTYNMLLSMTMIILTFGILIAHLVLEFMVPMLLHNGQTLGKKVFGVAVMRTGGIKVNGVCMFIRSILGKYAVETMIPVYIITMLFFNITGSTGTMVIFCLIAIQLALIIATKTNSLIHDKLADTVTVDMASQMIFDTEDDLLEYKKRVAAEQAAKDPYA